MKIRHAAAPAVFVALVFLVIGTFFRVIRADLAPGTLPNFSPLMAAALCGALFIPGWLGLVVPVAALLISDALLNIHDGFPAISSQVLWTLPCYLLAVGVGWMIRAYRGSLGTIMGATLVSSFMFYLVTNTGSWLGLAAYPQSFAGWVQAITTGLPGYPPTWMFFRNSLVSDLLFAACFVAAERALSGRRVLAAA